MFFIDYETICVNCKQKGYNFGYSFKTIKYKNQTILDMPQRHLNGAMISFEIENNPVTIHCLENAHQNSELADKPIFSMINAKHSQDDTISRFTYMYLPENDPNIDKVSISPPFAEPKLILYLDMYKPPDVPYFLLFFTFRLQANEPLKNFKFFQFYDFDIYGEDKYDTDIAEYDEDNQIIYQFDGELGEKKSIFAGIGSLNHTSPQYFEANNSKLILPENYGDNLKNIAKHGPDDCAVALEWEIDELYPEKAESFPIFIVAGEGKSKLIENSKFAREHLNKVHPTIFKLINDKFRQMIDPQLEEMSFSMKEWCK